MRDRFVKQRAADPAAPKFFVHINADLDRAAIGGAPDKLVETEPAREPSFYLGNPKRELVRRMPAEPRQPFLDRYRLEHRGGDPRCGGGVVNLDDVRQVGLNSIANNHFVRDTVSHREGKLGSIVSFQRSGLMFLNGPSCTGG